MAEFPGLSPTFQPMEHQAAMIARNVLGYNTLAAHAVGAGKTMEMVGTSIKLKQLGLLNKPMIAVPNHMLVQMAKEAKEMYPGANVLMINGEDLRGVRRKRFLAVARNNDWDIVVCTHSILNQIRPPKHIRLSSLETEIEQVLERKATADSKRIQRRLEARLKSLRSELEVLNEEIEGEEDSGNAITLTDLGIDGIQLDEAHAYKNLAINSAMNVLGVTTGGSKRAANIKGLADHLREVHGRSFGLNYYTGTPISNTICEMYVVNAVLRPELLESVGITSFDQWAKRFGKVVSALEALPEGGGFRVNERFSQYVNAPEMVRLFRAFADVKTRADLKLPVPHVETRIIAADMTEWQKLFMQHLTRRAVAIRQGEVKPHEDNMLALSTAGRKAALDMRLVDPILPDDSSAKLGMVAEHILFEHEQSAEVKGAQLVFMDIGTPGKKKPYSSYEQLKRMLVAKGIPEHEIAFMQDAKNNKEKDEIFEKVRSGEIRVLVGSTEKMGAGTNVQTRLCALHHIDCPWKPSDIEQRIGRIARRGNQFFSEVREYRYTTKDSFDLFMWETNKRKQDFITVGLSDPSSLDREIVEETDLGHAEVLAITTGEPRVKEKVLLDDQVAKLYRARRTWEGERVSQYSQKQKYTSAEKGCLASIAIEDKIQAALPMSKYKSVEVDGSTMGIHEGPATLLFATDIAARGLDFPHVRSDSYSNSDTSLSRRV